MFAENKEGAKVVPKACCLSFIIEMLQTLTRRAKKEHYVAILMSMCMLIREEVVSSRSRPDPCSYSPRSVLLLAAAQIHFTLRLILMEYLL
ncbi:hypothetical protein K1719_046101 [Acacia pycnantha]|nr:hypothetical protein K1719_046101 [Acacia pycnantha]